MATEYRNGETKFKTDSDEVAKFAIENGLFYQPKTSFRRRILLWLSALPLVGRLIRLLGGDIPSGP